MLSTRGVLVAASLLLTIGLGARQSSAREGGESCDERLRGMERVLATARGTMRGPVLEPPRQDGFIVPSAARGEPLPFKAVVVEVGLDSLWMDGQEVGGKDQDERLRVVGTRVRELWQMHRQLHPRGRLNREYFVIFDGRLSVRDAVRVVAALGREDRLVPLVLPEAGPEPLVGGRELEQRVQSIRGVVDAVSAPTRWTMLSHAMGKCAPSEPFGVRPGEGELDDDRFRERVHSQVQTALRVCRCGDAKLFAVESLLLDGAGALGRTMQRLPVALSATKGVPLLAGGGEEVMKVLSRFVANTRGAAGSTTVRLRARP